MKKERNPNGRQQCYQWWQKNEDGTKTVRPAHCTDPTTALADAAKLDRTDYAILFATNDYDNWPDLGTRSTTLV